MSRSAPGLPRAAAGLPVVNTPALNGLVLDVQSNDMNPGIQARTDGGQSSNQGLAAAGLYLRNGVADWRSWQAAQLAADAANGQEVATALGIAFNGTSFDRLRNQLPPVEIIASASRSATNSSAQQTNFNARGILLEWDITVVPGVDTVTLQLENRGGVSYIMLQSAAEVGVITRHYLIYPTTGTIGGSAPDLDISVNSPMARFFRATIVHSGAGAFEYSLSVQPVL